MRDKLRGTSDEGQFSENENSSYKFQNVTIQNLTARNEIIGFFSYKITQEVIIHQSARTVHRSRGYDVLKIITNPSQFLKIPYKIFNCLRTQVCKIYILPI